MSLPKTMKAIVIEKTGGYDVNQLKEVPTPTPSADKIIVKVEWGGVNYSQWFVLPTQDRTTTDVRGASRQLQARRCIHPSPSIDLGRGIFRHHRGATDL